MKTGFYKLLFVVALMLLFGGMFKFTNAQSGPPQTLITYPQIEGTEPVIFGMSLPQLIRYIYLFAVGICGAIALMAILLGAIKYIGAAGNSSKMGDAKDQIVSAILGVVILLSSYVILYTINPDLVRIGLRLPDIKTEQLQSPEHIASYRCICRCRIVLNALAKDLTITSYRTNTLWGASECKTINFGDGWQQCKTSCESTVKYGGLGGSQIASICTTLILQGGSTYTGSNVTSSGCTQPNE
jgi:hypothetical protein